MPSGSETGNRCGADRCSLVSANNCIRAIHLHIEEVLAFRIVKQQTDGAASKINADPARLPDDDRHIRIGEINPAFVPEARVSRRDPQCQTIGSGRLRC